MVGHVGQAGQHVPEIGKRIEPPAPAAFNHGVDDGAPFTGIRFPNEQPILLANGRGPDGILHEVVVDLHPAIGQVNFQCGPQAQGVIDGSTQQALR